MPYALSLFIEDIQKELIFNDEAGGNLHVKRTHERALNAERAARTEGQMADEDSISSSASPQQLAWSSTPHLLRSLFDLWMTYQ